MPVQKMNTPVNRVYNSPAAQQQTWPRSRKLRATSRQNRGAPSLYKQQTLTQIDFVGIDEVEEYWDGENEMSNEERHCRKHKRRRTEDDAHISTTKFHTQTLTQLEFVSTPTLRLDGLSDEENDSRIAYPRQKRAKDSNSLQNMGPPKTPSRYRVYEVPSSQSPLSPSSVRSGRSLPKRSPLRVLDINRQVRPLSPIRKEDVRGTPKVKLEIEDAYEYENEDLQTTVLRTPTGSLSPSKGIKSTAEPQHAVGAKKFIKDEVQDSDAENDEDLEAYYDDFEQESQVNRDAWVLKVSDTQGTRDQLQDTIQQFVQQIPSTMKEAAPPRSSQATTVSLSQPLTSSPPRLRRPNQRRPAELEASSPDEGLTAILDSPPNHSSSPADSEKEILMPFSIPSSQLLTRSQMLPESLMDDSLPPPPLLIEDSDLDE